VKPVTAGGGHCKCVVGEYMSATATVLCAAIEPNTLLKLSTAVRQAGFNVLVASRADHVVALVAISNIAGVVLADEMLDTSVALTTLFKSFKGRKPIVVATQEPWLNLRTDGVDAVVGLGDTAGLVSQLTRLISAAMHP
jgi:hypothetical protein